MLLVGHPALAEESALRTRKRGFLFEKLAGYRDCCGKVGAGLDGLGEWQGLEMLPSSHVRLKLRHESTQRRATLEAAWTRSWAGDHGIIVSHIQNYFENLRFNRHSFFFFLKKKAY